MGPANLAGRSAAGDGGDDADGLTRLDGCVEAVGEAHVLVGDEHVDEPAEAAGVVEEAGGEAGVGGLQRLEDLADGGAVDVDLGCTAREGAQLGGDTDGGHAQPSTSSKAALKASIVGGMVAVGRQTGATASMVLRPAPVM